MNRKFESISIDILSLSMKDRLIPIKNEKIVLRVEVGTLYEKTVTPFGKSGKVDVPKKFIGKREYLIVQKN